MIRKAHIDFAALALALAGALEVAVDVVGGQDLTWNVLALGVAFAIPKFVELYQTDTAADEERAAAEAPDSDA